jgi:DNA-binding transcriptional MerR regulator
MGLFSLNKKKEEEDTGFMPDESVSRSPPVEHVVSMRQQGFSNNQITTYLQREGYSPDLIFEAMNQANIKQGVESAPSGMATAAAPQPPPFSQPSQGGGEVDVSRIEEITEAIIDEKWNELVKNINKIIDWKDKVESRIDALEQEIKDLKSNFNSLHDAILGKVGEYDQNIGNLGADIKAMEKVFQKILPTLTDNISELSRISKDLKKK